MDSDDQNGVSEFYLISNGASYGLSRESLRLCGLIKTIIDGDGNSTELPLKPEYSAKVVKKCVDYLNYHQGREPEKIPQPIRSNDLRKMIADPWDADFISSLNGNELYTIINLANYLDIQPLLHLGCAKVASLVRQDVFDAKWQNVKQTLSGIVPENYQELDSNDSLMTDAIQQLEKVENENLEIIDPTNIYDADTEQSTNQLDAEPFTPHPTLEPHPTDMLMRSENMADEEDVIDTTGLELSETIEANTHNNDNDVQMS